MSEDSRSIDDLSPIVQPKARAFVAGCAAKGIDLLITSTYRSIASQDKLFAQGRTAPGKKVTNARGGQSFHNYRVAMDVVPLREGKPVWNTADPIWAEVARIGEATGLEWAGRWKTFKEMAHFQYTAGHPLSWFQGGGRL